MIDLSGPILLLRGDDATYRLTVTDEDDERINITGATIEFVLKASLGAPDPALISKSVGDGITILAQGDSDDTKGQADIVLVPADSSGITPGLYYLDIVVTIGGVRTHVVTGREFTIGAVIAIPAAP